MTRLALTVRMLTVAVRAWPWAELGATAALVGGWTLVTWAIAAIAPPRIVWRASGGLFLLALFGFRLFITIARDGLYALTREKS